MTNLDLVNPRLLEIFWHVRYQERFSSIIDPDGGVNEACPEH
jgi:hypothetical protein